MSFHQENQFGPIRRTLLAAGAALTALFAWFALSMVFQTTLKDEVRLGAAILFASLVWPTIVLSRRAITGRQ